MSKSPSPPPVRDAALGRAETEAELASLANRVEALERISKRLRNDVARQGEWIDCMSSSLVKRLWWWLAEGFCLRRVGRWRGAGKGKHYPL